MKSALKFYDFNSNKLSDCGEVLDIEFSSKNLGWQNVILEKGSSPHFYPNNVYTPYFYFAMGLEQELHWNAATRDGITELKTSPGEIWINPPKSPFSHEITEPCYFIILAIEEQRFLEHCSLTVDPKKLQFLNNYNVQDQTIKGIIELFLIEAKAGGNNGSAYLSNLLSLLASHYIQHYSNYSDLKNQHTNTSKFDQHQLDKLDTYIDEHISEGISIDALAEQLHCSKFYFLREFKKFVGVTPYQYLLNKRLEKAKTRLHSGSDIASIGFELGFNDQAHFTRAFKKQFGITPGQQQKQ